MYEAAIAQVGDSHLADWYRWSIATIHEAQSWGESAEAMRRAAAAKAIWERLTHSTQPALRHQANRKLRELAESTDTPDSD